jgi:hypothetical protein
MVTTSETAREILLDSDSTDDPCHGQQVFAFFHGKYGQHMYHQLYFFEAKTGCLLSARLRPGNASASEAIAVELKGLSPPLGGVFLKARSATAPMPARLRQQSMRAWNRSKFFMPLVSALTRCFNEEPSAG